MRSTGSTAKFRPILYDDWSIRLGENRSDQSSKTSGGYAGCSINATSSFLNVADPSTTILVLLTKLLAVLIMLPPLQSKLLVVVSMSLIVLSKLLVPLSKLPVVLSKLLVVVTKLLVVLSKLLVAPSKLLAVLSKLLVVL